MRIPTLFILAAAVSATVAGLSACGSSASSASSTVASSVSQSTTAAAAPTIAATTTTAAAATTTATVAASTTAIVPTATATATATTTAPPTTTTVSFPPPTGTCKLLTPQEIQQTVGVPLISMEQKTHGNEDDCLYGVTKSGQLTLGVSVIRKSGGVAIVNDSYGKFVDFPGHKAVWYGAMLYVAVGGDALEVDLTGANGHQSEQIAAAVAQIALSRM